jgi:preprotein translocase subunit SecG
MFRVGRRRAENFRSGVGRPEHQEMNPGLKASKFSSFLAKLPEFLAHLFCRYSLLVSQLFCEKKRQMHKEKKCRAQEGAKWKPPELFR